MVFSEPETIPQNKLIESYSIKNKPNTKKNLINITPHLLVVNPIFQQIGSAILF